MYGCVYMVFGVNVWMCVCGCDTMYMRVCMGFGVNTCVFADMNVCVCIRFSV